MYKIIPDIFKGKKILIAEDDASTYLYIEALLGKTVARLEWAKNGLEAVEAVKSNLVLMLF